MGANDRAGATERVRHARHGQGRVEAWRRGGRVAVVRFEGQALAVEVPAGELSRVEEVAAEAPQRSERAESVAKGAPESRKGADAEGAARAGAETVGEPRAQAARAGLARVGAEASARAGVEASARAAAALTLEAMRLGVVPARDLSAWTVGRDAELATVRGDLAQVAASGGSVRAILGDYGSGKTHLLETIQQTALADGYLTAMVMLDPSETTPSHPKRVYRALVRALRYPDRPSDEAGGLGPLLDRAAETPEALAAFGIDPPAPRGEIDDQLAAGLHLYLSPAIAYARSLAAPDAAARLRRVAPSAAPEYLARGRALLLDWLEGHPTVSNLDIDAHLSRLSGRHPRIYSLCDYRPWARIYGYLLSGLAALARAVGYKGLVVLLDEAELYALLAADSAAYARHLFKAWTYAAVGGPGGAGDSEPLPFDSAELGIGGAGVQQRLPGRYGQAPGLYTVFAMTPSPDGLSALAGAVPEGRITTLSSFDAAHYGELTRRVLEFYASANPDWPLPDKLVAPLTKVVGALVAAGLVATPRQAMKLIIELLDIMRYHPDRFAGVVRGIQQSVLF